MRLEKSEEAADSLLERSFLKDSLVLFEDDEFEVDRLDETEALFLMAKTTFRWASASLGLRVVERRTGALIWGLLLLPLLFMSSSDLMRLGSKFTWKRGKRFQHEI